MTTISRVTINDGFNPEFAEGARFEGILEYPAIDPILDFTLPKVLVPFSERNKVSNPSKAVVMFYEYDNRFADLIANPKKYIDDLKRFAGVISPDNSLYRDMPLFCQLANIYRSRLVGSFLQRNNIKVIGNVRWGDARTYTSEIFGEPPAFVGLPKNSIVSVGTYGCIGGERNRQIFKEGLRAMLDYLRPRMVIVYGAMPGTVFDQFRLKTKFINYEDWISISKKGGKNGQQR